MRERLELEPGPTDPSGLLQPLLEVALGRLKSTGPHLSGPEIDQRTLPAGPRRRPRLRSRADRRSARAVAAALGNGLRSLRARASASRTSTSRT